MFRVAGLCPNAAEAATLREAMRDTAAFAEEGDWCVELHPKPDDFQLAMERTPEPGLCCIDVSGAGALELAAKVRERFPELRLLLLAQKEMPPTRYLRPSILPSALLLKPFGLAEARIAARELFLSAYKVKTLQSGTFTVTTRKGQIRLPYAEIRYFEAQGKKILVCAGSREYCFYATLESLSETLPKGFVRCHKGFIVNRSYVMEVSFQQGELTLTGGYIVPVSRSYRSLFRSSEL